MNEIVSIIVPVYNAQEYLDQCLSSILNQTYPNIDIILVNDGSTDNSVEICEAYARLDQRFRIINKKNEGSTSARKTGILEARGDYIAFVDSDDWIEPTFIEFLRKEIIQNAVDIVASGCIKEYGDYSEHCLNRISEGVYRDIRLEEKIFPRMLYYKDDFYTFGIQQYLWNKIYRKDIIYTCLMSLDDRIYNGEDVACVFDCILHSNSILLSNACLYHYRIRNDSITTREDYNIFHNIAYLHSYMRKRFQESIAAQVMLPQLNLFTAYMVSMASRRMYNVNVTAVMRKPKEYLFPFGLVEKGSRIVLYGCGEVGKAFYRQLHHSKYCDIVLWVDRDYLPLQNSKYNISDPEMIRRIEYNYIIICVENSQVAAEITNKLRGIGVEMKHIIWSDKYLI